MRNLILLIASLILSGVATAQDHGVVIASDYNSAATVARIALSDPWTVEPDLEPVYHDASARWHDGLVYIVNRAGADNIQVLDPDQDLATVRQFSLGLGRGLRDIAFLDDGTAYVSCYDAAELLHIDPADGTILHTLSTAAFADADGLPETGWLLRDGDRLFLTCERLDRDGWYAPVGDSYLLVLDLATRTWIDCDPGQPGTQGILLAAVNPYCDLVRQGSRLLVGCNGYYALQDGGVDVVDLESLTSLGLEITEAALGGDLVDLAGGADGRRHAVIADASFHTSIKAYHGGGDVTLLAPANAYDHADICYDGDFQLFVADRHAGAAGVRVYDALSGVELTSGPLNCGLPPALIALPDDPAVPVLDLPGATLVLAAPWPNPANPRASVALTASAFSAVDLRVIDLRGRLVQRASINTDGAGRAVWEFDGRDRHGWEVASGVYRVVATGQDGYAARSLTLVR